MPPLEFDFRVLGDGRSASARYANNSNYRNDSLIRKESMATPMRPWFKTSDQTNEVSLCSVCELPYGGRDQAHHQDQRDHEVRHCSSPRVINDLHFGREDDGKWPQKNKDGRQELEIRLGSEHISFEVCREDHLYHAEQSLTRFCLDRQDRLSRRCD